MSFKKVEDIPFVSLTAGQAEAATESLYANTVAKIEQKKGNYELAKKWTNRANDIARVMPHIHNIEGMNNYIAISNSDSYLQKIIRDCGTKTRPALREDPKRQGAQGLAAFNGSPLSFDPTEEQIQGCIDFYDKVYGPSSSRAKTAAIQSCIAKLPYQNIIQQHIAKSGAAMLYTVIKTSSSNFNNDIRKKDNLQAQWARNASIATGLPEVQVLRHLQINLMEEWGEMPETIEHSLRPFMTNTSAGNAQNIVPQTKTPDIILPTGGLGGSGVLGTGLTTGNPLIDTIINIAALLVKAFIAFKRRNDEAKAREEAFRNTPTIEEDIIMKCWDFNGVETDCSLSSQVAVRICTDSAGNEIPCPEEEGSNSNTLLYYGIGAAVLGAILLNNDDEKEAA